MGVEHRSFRQRRDDRGRNTEQDAFQLPTSLAARSHPHSPVRAGRHGRVAERIGDYLVRTGKLLPAEVGQVIGAQKAGDGRTFGEIAVGLGLVDKAAVDSFLASQGK